MPLKYSIYRIFCFICLLLLLIHAGSFFYHFLTDPRGPDNRVPFAILELCICFIYFMNFFQGLKLVNKLKRHQPLLRRQQMTIIVFYVLQMIIQLLAFYRILTSLSQIRSYIEDLLSLKYYDDLATICATIAIPFFTIYYQVFTIPLMNSITKKYKDSMLQQLDAIAQNP